MERIYNRLTNIALIVSATSHLRQFLRSLGSLLLPPLFD